MNQQQTSINMSTTTFTAITADGKTYEVSRKAARLASYFQGMLESFEGFPMPEAIPVEYVNSADFEKVLEFLNHYENSDPKPMERMVWRPLEESIPEWDFKYISSFTGPELHAFNKAAEYLMIEPLLDLIAFSMATTIKDMSLEESVKYYGVPMPTEEEIKAIEQLYWEKYALPADL